MKYRIGVTLLAVVLAASTASAASSDEWAQYRGPGSAGSVAAAGLFEKPAGVGLQVGWKQTIGSGYSSVVVAGGRVITMFTDGPSDVIAAFDETTGAELWRHSLGEMYPGHDGSHDGPLSTPLIAGKRVIGLTPRGMLFAVEAATGEPGWSVNLVEKYGLTAPSYGFGMSPVLAEGVLVLQLGAADAAVAAFDAKTGERLWTAGADGASYQTPAVIELDGRDVLVAGGREKLYGIEPRSGKVLWEYAHEGGGGGYGEGKLTPVPAGPGRLFLAHKSDSSTVVRLKSDDGKVTVEKLWENRNIRHSYTLPVYHDGFLYAYSSRFLICVDAGTGEPRWRSREPGDGFLMLVDRHLVIVTKEGSVHVARADPSGYEELAGLAVLDDLAWAPPSFANGHIFLRGLSELARVDVGSGKTFAAGDHTATMDLSGTKFGALLAKIEKSDDKQALVDKFVSELDQTPMIEGRIVAHFLYRGPATDVALAGDLIGVSSEVPMKRVEGTDLFHWSTRLEPDARVNYLLIVDYEETLDPRNPRRTETLMYGEDMELSFSGTPHEMSWFAMPGWREPGFLGPVDPGREGRVETREIDSELLGKSFPVEVYLPAGYDESDTRYPVVYVHGGANARERGQWQTALDNLIGRSVDPLIAVFIGQLGVPFTKAAESFPVDVVPWVDANFRTVPEASARANVGQGFGGVAAFFSTFGAPGLVGKLATQSAFMLEFAWNPLQPMIKSPEETPAEIYIEWGKYDMRSDHENWNLADANREIADDLRGRGYSVTGVEVHDGTGWSSWRSRTGPLLEALFGRVDGKP